jgi:hypothetical protein
MNKSILSKKIPKSRILRLGDKIKLSVVYKVANLRSIASKAALSSTSFPILSTACAEKPRAISRRAL